MEENKTPSILDALVDVDSEAEDNEAIPLPPNPLDDGISINKTADSGSIQYPLIDNKNIELIRHPNIHAHFIVKIKTAFLAKSVEEVPTFESIKEFCNTLFSGKYETDPKSVTFQYRCDYRIKGNKNFILIQGDQTSIEGALKRLELMHCCISSDTTRALLNELEQEATSRVRASSLPRRSGHITL